MAQRPQNSPYRMIGEYAAMPFTFAACLFVGYLIGYLLDRALGTHFLYLVFLLLGAAGGLVQIIRQVTKDTDAGG